MSLVPCTLALTLVRAVAAPNPCNTFCAPAIQACTASSACNAAWTCISACSSADCRDQCAVANLPEASADRQLMAQVLACFNPCQNAAACRAHTTNDTCPSTGCHFNLYCYPKSSGCDGASKSNCESSPGCMWDMAYQHCDANQNVNTCRQINDQKSCQANQDCKWQTDCSPNNCVDPCAPQARPCVSMPRLILSFPFRAQPATCTMTATLHLRASRTAVPTAARRSAGPAWQRTRMPRPVSAAAVRAIAAASVKPFATSASPAT